MNSILESIVRRIFLAAGSGHVAVFWLRISRWTKIYLEVDYSFAANESRNGRRIRLGVSSGTLLFRIPVAVLVC